MGRVGPGGGQLVSSIPSLPWALAQCLLTACLLPGQRPPPAQKVGEDRLRNPPPQTGAQTNLSDLTGLIAPISMAMGYPPPFLRRGYPD